VGGGSPQGSGRIKCIHTYKDIISLENLLGAWKEFRNGKRKRRDVLEFERDLMHNIVSLHDDLVAKSYRHAPYNAFKINDPKLRDIHKAAVRDRLLHHVIYRKLYPFFDKTFITDSYSCRVGKGTHKALDRFRDFAGKVSKNHTRTAWVLKCDIRKFFASIDQKILISILKKYIFDKNVINLLRRIIGSFYSIKDGVGLPLGNLTSQLLVNIYMNRFDRFMKHKLKTKYYIRYADDFVILSRDRMYLKGLIPLISNFLEDSLKLRLHPTKVFIKTFASGVDFLGWVHFSDHRILRTSAKKRMMRNIRKNGRKSESVQSYLGLIQHGNSYKLTKEISRLIAFL
jgi:retron-type reverse transcriptase